MLKMIFWNRSFAGFVAGLLAGWFLGAGVQNVILAYHPEILYPEDLRDLKVWQQMFTALPWFVLASQLLAWICGTGLGSFLSTRISGGIAIVGLGSGIFVWLTGVIQSFQAPYPIWYKVILILSGLVFPLFGMITARVMTKFANSEIMSQN